LEKIFAGDYMSEKEVLSRINKEPVQLIDKNNPT
jgi:hypothetical protein